MPQTTNQRKRPSINPRENKQTNARQLRQTNDLQAQSPSLFHQGYKILTCFCPILQYDLTSF
ncbi:unnamed protein product [Periconia digitata]|uniref:Uncharacterized protein n=1 Tax=Periconia digitata TaxID=1303443 RepID=A0A9W4U9Q7_9PLEO|nr:unnamed protein product [Periconia digitata]